MNEQISALIALGASASANCRPCLEHHLGLAREAGNTEEDIASAVQIGLGVSEGARRKTAEFTDEMLQREPIAVAANQSGRCC